MTNETNWGITLTVSSTTFEDVSWWYVCWKFLFLPSFFFLRCLLASVIFYPSHSFMNFTSILLEASLSKCYDLMPIVYKSCKYRGNWSYLCIFHIRKRSCIHSCLNIIKASMASCMYVCIALHCTQGAAPIRCDATPPLQNVKNTESLCAGTRNVCLWLGRSLLSVYWV